jgi:nucleotide-binding universal stress UspA family protein
VTVVSQGDTHADVEFSGNTVIHDLLLSAGRPLIVIPNGFVAGPVGHHITVAWNGSREASRAVADAMPMLQMAEKVSVLVARSDDAQEVIRLVLDHLNRNLVAASARVLDAGDHDAGAAILAEADADGSDLIVMGGYGRARLREFVLGGATRQIVHHAPIPILVSH